MAHELVERGDWTGAFALLNEMHQARPADPEVLTLRGIVYASVVSIPTRKPTCGRP